jgi:hypothetical protein
MQLGHVQKTASSGGPTERGNIDICRRKGVKSGGGGVTTDSRHPWDVMRQKFTPI